MRGPGGRRLTAAEEDPELARAVAAELRRMLLLNRVNYTVGALAYVVVVVVVDWSILDHRRLALWASSGLVVVLVLFGAFAVPGGHWLGRDGMPVLLRPAGYLAGIMAGSLLWIDLATIDRSSTARGAVLGAVVTMSAVVQTPTVVGTGHSLRVQVPSLVLASAAFAAIGEYPLAIGVTAFLLIVGSDSVRSRRLVVAGVLARVEAERASIRDPLTGLANRTALLTAIRRASRPSDDAPRPGGVEDIGRDPTGHAGRAGGEVTAMFVDLDRFKQINDRYGHAAGDELLRQAAGRLRSCFRAEDVVARMGGDEFVILITGLAPIDVDEMAGRVAVAMEQTFPVADRDVLLSASVGIATMPRGTSAEELLANADRALYKAKRDGRRRVVRYEPVLSQAAEARHNLEMALRRAVRAGEIVPFGQPVFCLRTGRVVSVELLARWIENGSHVSPGEFIALAEEVGLIRDLGLQMLDHATRALRRWSDLPGLADVGVAVNISPLHVVHGLIQDLAAVLPLEDPVDPARLTLEITEQQALPDEDGTKEVLDAVSARGVQLAIDDFGAGFSSIQWLISLPIDLVKLDRSLLGATASAATADEGTDVLGSVARLTRAMSRTTVAEGIETLADLACVRRAGIERGQGYLLARPMPLPELERQAARLAEHAAQLLSDSPGDRPGDSRGPGARALPSGHGSG